MLVGWPVMDLALRASALGTTRRKGRCRPPRAGGGPQGGGRRGC